MKRNLKLRDYKKCLKASQIENKMNYLEKKHNDVENNLIVKSKLILKTLEGFKSEWHNVFAEVINKIALNSSDDKRMQSINSIKTYAYRTSKDLVCKKEKFKCNNIIKQYKNV